MEEQTLVYYYDAEGNEVEPDENTVLMTNVGEFRIANKFYVLTASDYLQSSYGMKEDFQTVSGSYNVFPYYIKDAATTSSSYMKADTSKDGKLTLQELYKYVYTQSLSRQTTLVYPTNCSTVIFTK